MENKQNPERKMNFYRRMRNLGFGLVLVAMGAMVIDGSVISRVVYRYPEGFPKEKYESLLDFKRHSELVRDAMSGELGEYYGRLKIQLEAPSVTPGYEEPIFQLEENRIENVRVLENLIEHADKDIEEVKEGYKSYFAKIERYSSFRRRACLPFAIATFGGYILGSIGWSKEDKYYKMLRKKEDN